MMHLSGYLGTLTLLIGLLISTLGFPQHRAPTAQAEPPPDAPAPSRFLHVLAAIGGAHVCALLAIYLADQRDLGTIDLAGVERDAQLPERPAQTVASDQREALVAL